MTFSASAPAGSKNQSRRWICDRVDLCAYGDRSARAASGRHRRSVRWLGAISYPLYVSHFVVLILTLIVLKQFGLAANALDTVPVATAAVFIAELIRWLTGTKVSARQLTTADET